MTETVLSSATKEVVIGFERPFVIIGERINPTGRKKLAEEMAAGNFETVVADAIAQVEAGAQMLDVNAGIPLADEPAILAQAIELVQGVTDVPLSIDSSIVAALESGLSVYQGKALVNSVTGEEDRLESVLPLVAKHGAAVVAITNDESGISEDPDVRFEVARTIVSRAADHGIPKEDVVVDPLVMPIGALGNAGPSGLPDRAPAARGARREHDLRRVERQLRAPEPARAERRVPADGDRLRPDLGDHEPAPCGDAPGGEGGRRADGQRRALRGVDRPITETRDRRALQRGRRGGREGRRRAASVMSRPTRSSSSPRPGGAGGSSTARPCSTPRGGSGVDLDSVCGGRGICGRCQVEVAEGEHAKHGIIVVAHEPLARSASSSARTRPTGASQTGVVSAARPASSATSSSTFRPRASSTARSCARRPTRTRSRSTRSCACTTSRSSGPSSARPPEPFGG